MNDSFSEHEDLNLYKLALDHLQEGCQIIDFNYRYIYLNPVAIQHSGKEKSELIGKTMMEVFPGIETTRMFQVLTESIESRKSATMENKFEFPNKEETWFKLSFAPNPSGILILSTNISDPKRSEISLRKTNESIMHRWRFALEGSGDGIWDWNISTNTIFYSEQWKRLIGYASDEITDSSEEWTSRIHLGDLENYKSDIQTYKEGNTEFFHTEHRILCKDGNYKWFLVKGKSVEKSNNQKIQRIIGTISDISERKLAEEKLREITEFQNIILNSTDYSIISTDEAGTITAFNHGSELMLGYKAEEVVNKTSPAIFHDLNEIVLRAKILSEELKKDIQPGFEVFVAKSKLGIADTNEWTYILKDKTRIKVELSVTPLRNKKEEITGFLGIAKDIRESIKAKEELIHAKDLAEATNQALLSFKFALDEHALVSITDTKGRITYLNEKFCTVSKYSSNELLGKDHRIINSGFHSKEFFKELWDTIKNKSVWKGDVKNKAKDGTFYWVSSTIVALLDIKGNPNQYIAIRTDITERKMAEIEILQAKDQAEKANQAKSEFLANMTHELRTPLNGVIGFSDLLMKMDLNESQKLYMSTIYKSANSLLELINDILDFSKIESGKLDLNLDQIDLLNLLDQVVDLTSYKANEKNINILLSIEESVPGFIITDPIRLRQIILNLVGNAIKFTEIGKIEIQVKVKEMNSKEKKAKLIISVKDTGIGISKENQQKIFNAFEQADSSTTRKYGGTGLGLSISNKLLSLMGSKLELESEIGIGSIFYFELQTKFLPDTNLITKLKKESAEGITKNFNINKDYFKILIVDDNPVNLFLMQSILRQLLPNANILEANNGNRALEIYNSEKPELIFMDVQMPGMNGYETTIAIRKLEINKKSIPIIALTAGTVKGEREKCTEAGMNDYITKPVIKETIEKTLISWLFAPEIIFTNENIEKDTNYMKHFDEDLLLERLDYDREFLGILVSKVKENFDSDSEGIIVELSESNFATIKAGAHKLKGTALTVCFEQLASLSETLESLEEYNQETVQKLVSQIKEEIEFLKVNINL
ncbi:MAG: PAS domain S-box protein [Leptospiraceae bacterium]|nr:PAS domain S-box protein [Leptospiraceae bacterium]